jgi:6,7-dimethyl-8-ribityllumazine synthase
MTERRGTTDAAGRRVALVVSRFNETYTAKLLAGAREMLAALGAREDDVDVFWVPGSFEIPQAARLAARSGRYDAVVGLGVLIRGATLHFELVAREAAHGLAAVARETGVPAVFGIVTAENEEQAAERTGGRLGNRGADAARTAVEMANLFRGMRRGEAPAPPVRHAGDDALLAQGVPPHGEPPRGRSKSRSRV